MISRFKICVSLVIVSIFFFSVSFSHSQPLLIRFSHVVGENTPKGIGAKMFKKLVESRLKGKVAVEIFPNSQKFTDEQALLGLLFGDIEMAAPSFPKFHKFSKKLGIFDLPFLFNNVTEVHSFQQSQTGIDLLSSMENIGIKGLCYWDNGMRIISTDTPVKEPGDLQGLTLRIESSCIIKEQYASLKAIGIQMPFKRLPDSLREGVVNGYENAWSNVLSRKLHTLRPYFIETNHSYLGYMVVTSNKFWESLPDDIRSELEAILDEVTLEVNKLAEHKADIDRASVLSNSKVHLTTLTTKERQSWKDVMVPIWKNYESEIGVDVLDAAKASKSNKTQ